MKLSVDLPTASAVLLSAGLAGVLILGLFGISTSAESRSLPSSASPPAGNRSQLNRSGLLTFNKDVAPIVFLHCASCHRRGEVAPFPLLTYQDVRKRATLIAAVLEKRVMPPWKPEPGYGDFRDARRLTGVEPIHAVVGGFHLTGSIFEPIIAPTVAALKEIAPAVLVPEHCTGWKAHLALARELPDAYVPNSVGTRLELVAEPAAVAR